MLVHRVTPHDMTPVLGALGMGSLVAVATGAYNAIEVGGILLALLVVAVAGIFTIRSNVAKIWREQAEGEKARNLDLTAQLAEVITEHADVIAKMKLADAEVVAELHRVAAELEAANLRTDLTSVVTKMADHHAETIAVLLSINDSLTKGLVNGAHDS